MLKKILLASMLTLAASAASADPGKDESGNHPYRDGRYYHDGDRYDRRDRHDGYDRDDRSYGDRRDRDRRYSRRIPAGHLPPPGSCRVWFRDRPAGHQPPPMSCREARRYAYRYGGRVIGGGRHY